MEVDSGAECAHPGRVISRRGADDDRPKVELALLEDVAVVEDLADGIPEVVVTRLIHVLSDSVDVSANARLGSLKLEARALTARSLAAVAGVIAITSEDAQDCLQRLNG